MDSCCVLQDFVNLSSAVETRSFSQQCKVGAIFSLSCSRFFLFWIQGKFNLFVPGKTFTLWMITVLDAILANLYIKYLDRIWLYSTFDRLPILGILYWKSTAVPKRKGSWTKQGIWWCVLFDRGDCCWWEAANDYFFGKLWGVLHICCTLRSGRWPDLMSHRRRQVTLKHYLSTATHKPRPPPS